MNLVNNNNLVKVITTCFFAVAIVEVISELFAYKPFLFIFKPLISILLIVLYWYTSSQRNILFFMAILFSLITNVLFIPNTEKLLFVGLLFFFFQRMITIYYIARLLKLKDYIPVAIAAIPFLFIFFYLLCISKVSPTSNYFILLIQNILISIIGGITISNYVMNNNNKRNTFLFIFGLLALTQYFIVFIEKYYLANLSPVIFRPIAMILNTTVYYMFYRFVLETEAQNIEN